jgi:hypothetical protein
VKKPRRAIQVILAAGVLLLLFLVLPARHQASPPAFAAPRSVESEEISSAERDKLLSRARVRRPAPAAPVDFSVNPPDPSGLLSQPVVNCQYLRREEDGTSAKFHCVLADGEIVKVKYGGTAEIHAEVAATRLLAALGFGAERMYLVQRIRCYGCGRTPFYTGWLLDRVRLREIVTGAVPDDRYTEFEWAAVERRLPGAEIESDDMKGWAWDELARLEATGAATRAELDAFRLIAVFLAHWDNKAENQRLVCLDAKSTRPADCTQPLAFIQDLGSTFGPRKVDLAGWKNTPIWADAGRCRVSMREMPFQGSTFVDAEISEEGRLLLSRELKKLDTDQIRALFAAARFDNYTGETAGVDAWVAAFEEKVRQIADRGACPMSDRGSGEARSEPTSGTSPARR